MTVNDEYWLKEYNKTNQKKRVKKLTRKKLKNRMKRKKSNNQVGKILFKEQKTLGRDNDQNKYKTK